MTTTLIAICGASGSGKTAFATSLVESLSNTHGMKAVSLLHEDAYYKDLSYLDLSARAQVNFDHPDAFDYSLLIEHLEHLKAGKPVEMPVYDYVHHTRAQQTCHIPATKVIIIEGILLFSHAELRQLFDTKVFIDAPLDICLARRLKRDILERGRSFECVLSQYETTVRPMYFEFIAPNQQWADIVLPHGGLNAVAQDLFSQKIASLLDT